MYFFPSTDLSTISVAENYKNLPMTLLCRKRQ